MASNGLIANAAKTSVIFLNTKNRTENTGEITIKIGNETVTQETHAKLLGMTFEDSQQWKTHIHNKGGLITALNSRLFLIRRLKNYLNSDALLKIVDGLFTSKIRYGLQLMGKVRRTEEDPKNAELMAIQKVQNKLLRLLTNTKISDRVSNAELLERVGMLSVNQINAQIKLGELWKATHYETYPTKFTRQNELQTYQSTRACAEGKLVEEGSKTASLKTFKGDASTHP